MPPLVERILLFRDPVPHSAALNMAIDEILLKETGQAVLRVYGWQNSAASFGYFEPYSRVWAENPGRELVRRWTGGGTVLHGEDFTYTLIAPRGSALERLRIEASYKEIHERVSRLLGGCLAESKSMDHATACFQNPTIHDVLVTGRKIAGAAQRRTRWGLLHQGSIQQIGVPASFGAEFARSIATEVIESGIAPDVISRAEECAAIRYGTEAWLKRI